MNSEFTIGERVRASCGTALDPADKIGEVESFHDWWVMVRMESGILTPFLAGELEHVVRTDHS